MTRAARPAPRRPGAIANRAPLDPRLLRHARSSRLGVAGLALAGGGQAAATVAVAVALSLIVAGSHGWAVGLLAAAYACRACLAWAEQVVARRTAARVTGELRHAILRELPRRGPAWVAGFGAGRLTAVLTGGLDALRPWFTGYLPALILGVALPPLVVGAIALTDPASALIALATLPLIPVLGALIGWATQVRARERWAADARLAGHFLDVVRGLPTLRVFGRAERQTAVVADLTDRHRTATLRVLRVAFLSSTALDLVGTLSVGLIAVEAGLRVAAGHLALGPALLVILLAPEAYRPLREMAARYHAATDATAVISDVDEILRPGDPAATTTAATAGAAGAPGSLPGPGVEASGLRARYPGATADALTLPSLSVRPGEIVALCGPSGAGKTTALRVIAGQHPATAGTVAVANPLYLPQRPVLPHARTVADLFDPAPPDIPPTAHLSEPAVRPPGAGAHPAETATHLAEPGGYSSGAGAAVHAALAAVGLDGELTAETELGEQGAGVSAGQRQRLALAALLHRAARHPGTLLLDEPTAHLDPETERQVIAQLREAADAGAAVLVVAHRPALRAAADRTVDLAPPPGAVIARPDELAPSRHAAPVPSVSPPASPKIDISEISDRMEGGPETRSRAGAPSRARAAAPIRAALWARGGWRSWAAVGLGSGSSLAGLVLTGAAAWLLVRAATLPPVLTLSAAVVLVRGSAVARPLLRYLERLVAHDVAFARLGARRARVYAALVPRVPGPRLRRRGDLLSRVVDDVDARVDGLLRGRLPALAAATTLGVATLVAVWITREVAVPLAVGLVVSGLLAPAVAAWQASREDAATAGARARLRDAMVEAVAGVEESPARGDVPRRRSAALARLEARAAQAAGLATAVAHLGWGFAVAGCAYALDLAPEWSAVVLLAVVALGESVLTLPDTAVARTRATGATARLASLTSEPLPVTFPPETAPTGTPPTGAGPGGAGPGGARAVGARVVGAVSVRGLWAGWDRGREPVLRGLDLELPAGSRVAVVGRSGSGKSTLGAVLGRLLDPRAGSVTADGRDLREWPERAVRGRVVLVGEDTEHVFASTVRENLRLARPEAGDEELRSVLTRVRLDGWLGTLPAGLGTWLGTGGSTMSGGQVRRFAVARALLADPGLLILDEPTEGLDAGTAEAVMADLLDAASGRTVLLLTHRTEGLDRVDRVFSLTGGRLTAPDSRRCLSPASC